MRSFDEIWSLAVRRKGETAIQAAFNTWKAQSGRALTEISRVLALSID
ncbi:hypothetical protein [Rhizobium sp. SSA_523]|nr:hypothetical protein [Rhizobium sp. SSA_523]MCO5733167.1 hypothetical protein [Rhizobium sp. SSA_523]WKC24037.1 hypothetical protein QTJ18_25310 [Rhizobium sp. SSA_523]